MNNFIFHSPTKIYFGKDQELLVGQIIKEAGFKKVLFHYGKSSIFKTGLYDKIVESLKKYDVDFIELGGVEANPKIELVRQGVELVKESNVDFILAVGGGSVIDSAKSIACGAKINEDPWLFSAHELTPKEVLPIGVVLTISAAGSELSNSCVITNEKFNLKRGFNSDLMRPKFAILNPELTYSVSKYQTGCGIVDIMMHTIERYLVLEDADLTHSMAEGLLKSVMRAGSVAIKEPNNYEARSTLMLASSLSHNGLTGLGVNMFFTVHKLEHELSGFYDEVAHGAGLSILFPAWARFMANIDCHKLAKFAWNVMDVAPSDSLYNDALEGINRLEKYFKSLDMPTRIVDLNLENVDFEGMALSATNNGQSVVKGIKDLYYEDILQIYKNSYK